MGKMSTGERITDIAEISKFEMKRNYPGPGRYLKDAWKAQSNKGKVGGFPKQSDIRITFAAESANLYGESPLAKYGAYPVDKQFRSSPKFTIEKNVKRPFQKETKKTN